MEIQQATQAQVKDICALYEELFAASGAQQPAYFRAAPGPRAYVQSILQNPAAALLVAVRAGQAVGFVHVCEKETPRLAAVVFHRYAGIEEIAVAQAHRRAGVGTALLQAAGQWAAARGLDYTELGVLPQNTAALRLYEKCGYSAARLVLRKLIK